MEEAYSDFKMTLAIAPDDTEAKKLLKRVKDAIWEERKNEALGASAYTSTKGPAVGNAARYRLRRVRNRSIASLCCCCCCCCCCCASDTVVHHTLGGLLRCRRPVPRSIVSEVDPDSLEQPVISTLLEARRPGGGGQALGGIAVPSRPDFCWPVFAGPCPLVDWLLECLRV